MRLIYLVYRLVATALLFMLYVVCLNEFGLTRNWNYFLFTLPPTIVYILVSSYLKKMIDVDKK